MTDDEIDAIADRVVDLPPKGQVDFLLRMLEKVGDDRDRLRAVVEDVTGHATPIAEDDDGFVAVGYTVTVGTIHRALAVLQGAGDDSLHPLMPTGEDQPFRDWLDFVEHVARPIVEAESDEETERAAMVLYRKASPFFICAALVMAANRALDVSPITGGDGDTFGGGPGEVGVSRTLPHPAVHHTRLGHYLSTYCLHDEHENCRLTCKICEAPCRCSCHLGGVTDG